MATTGTRIVHIPDIYIHVRLCVYEYVSNTDGSKLDAVLYFTFSFTDVEDHSISAHSSSFLFNSCTVFHDMDAPSVTGHLDISCLLLLQIMLQGLLLNIHLRMDV